jgi:hypothetical protein
MQRFLKKSSSNSSCVQTLRYSTSIFLLPTSHARATYVIPVTFLQNSPNHLTYRVCFLPMFFSQCLANFFTCFLCIPILSVRICPHQWNILFYTLCTIFPSSLPLKLFNILHNFINSVVNTLYRIHSFSNNNLLKSKKKSSTIVIWLLWLKKNEYESRLEIT